MKIGDFDRSPRQTARDLYEKDPKEFDFRQKMLYNKEADKEQLARYRKRFGKDAPRKLSDFQDLKYRDPEKYAELKEYYRYRGVATDSDIRFFYADKAKNALIAQGEIRAKGIVVKRSPITLTNINDHAKQQISARGITIEQAQKL